MIHNLTVYIRTLVAALAVIWFLGSGSSATEIWIGTDEPEWRRQNQWPPNDYLDLFKPDAPWSTAAANIAVLHLSKRFVIEATDDEIKTVISDLQRRHIKIAVQGTPLLATKSCGLGIEGYGPPDDMVRVARRIKDLGGVIDYVAMDEPLWFGHRFNGKPGTPKIPCHSSIQEVAHQTAVKMKAMEEIFPNVKIGDIEPMGIISEDLVTAWKGDIPEWMDAYQGAMGKPLDFFQLDVVWLRPTWRQVFDSAVSAARAHKIPIGIIYNGTPRDSSDLDWVGDAEAHFKYVEQDLKIHPDQALIWSWMDRPREILPETKEGTLTNLVLRYVRWRAHSH